ncbi:MAG: YraN family protein [Paludibacteraceae bacterium]|nr:YraN family protein [Paludibacteraceae bacterium]
MAFVTDPIGIAGEQEAAKLLEKKGFKVIERNWRMGHLEVDLIAENRHEIVFAEVKARTSTFGDVRPEEFVDAHKKQRMIAAANAYIKYRKTEKLLRFDIIGVLLHPETLEITYRCHLENAFYPSNRTLNTGSFNGQWKWEHRNKTIGSKRR